EVVILLLREAATRRFCAAELEARTSRGPDPAPRAARALRSAAQSLHVAASREGGRDNPECADVRYSNRTPPAVNPWLKVFPPIGPGSPAAKKPARASGPTSP